MTGTFYGRIEDLKRLVGDKKLEGKVVVNQIYAQFQHETLSLRHPHGGGGKFLTKSLVQNRTNILQDLARNTLNGRLNQAMAKGMENVTKGVYHNAPHEFNDLRNSGHPTVKDRGRFVYNRPPMVKRLSKNQLRAKDRARGK